jgi:hypothetical protein
MVANGRRLVSDLRSIRAGWESKISARRDSAIHRVADLLLKRLVIKRAGAPVRVGHIDGNARRYADPLTEAGVIAEFADRARNRAWRAPEVLGALRCIRRTGRTARTSRVTPATDRPHGLEEQGVSVVEQQV